MSMTPQRRSIVICFALHLMAAESRHQANMAAQDTNGRWFKRTDFERFMKDAEDAEALLAEFRADSKESAK